MIQSRKLLSRSILLSLVIAPIGLMGILSVKVLLPTLSDPQSRFYSSGFGYPALQRMAGKAIQVDTVTVAATSLENNVGAPGESVAMQQVDVRSLVSGLVQKVYAAEGQLVRRGQPLLELQRAPFQDQVNTASNNLAAAEKNLKALQSTVPDRLNNLRNNLTASLARLNSAETRLAKIDSLAEKEIQNNVVAAEVRLQTAQQKLKQIQFLEQQGAISKFQRYDMEDIYATRKRELLAAQQGIIGTQSQQFGNQDFYIQRRNELISDQQQLELAQANLDRDLANARLTLENRRIELQQALRDLTRTVVYASTDGLVSRVNIHSGEVADARSRDPLLTLTQNTVFKAYIDQARLGAVKIGDMATVRLVAYPGQSFRGQVIQLNPTVENETIKGKAGIDRQYTYSVWIAVNDLKMPPGLQGYVQFQKGKTALTIPESAVTHLSAGEGMVMVALDGKAVIRKVKFGRTFGNKREVLVGLKPGERVVLNARALNPGDSITPESVQVPIAEDK